MIPILVKLPIFVPGEQVWCLLPVLRDGEQAWQPFEAVVDGFTINRNTGAQIDVAVTVPPLAGAVDFAMCPCRVFSDYADAALRAASLNDGLCTSCMKEGGAE